MSFAKFLLASLMILTHEYLHAAAQPAKYKPDDARVCLAMETDNFSALRDLFSADDLDISGEAGFDALRHATTLGRTAMALWLLENGAPVHPAQESGRTPLHTAACLGNEPLVKALLARGAKVAARDQIQCTPLHEAACSRNLACAQLLLNAKASVYARTSDLQTPLHGAADPAMAALLLAQKADPNAQDTDGFTPLHSMTYSSAAKVDVLLAGCADPNIPHYYPVLHRAVSAYTDRQKIVASLIAARADVNAQDAQGYTPLHWVQQDDTSTAQQLVTAGANLDLIDKKYGLSARQTLLSKGIRVD